MVNKPITAAEYAAAMEILILVGHLIQIKGTIPSGELYAVVMGSLDLRTYGAVLDKLESAGLIKNSGHMLTWTGPSIAAVKGVH
jgi:hypothetical protein